MILGARRQGKFPAQVFQLDGALAQIVQLAEHLIILLAQLDVFGAGVAQVNIAGDEAGH